MEALCTFSAPICLKLVALPKRSEKIDPAASQIYILEDSWAHKVNRQDKRGFLLGLAWCCLLVVPDACMPNPRHVDLHAQVFVQILKPKPEKPKTLNPDFLKPKHNTFSPESRKK